MTIPKTIAILHEWASALESSPDGTKDSIDAVNTALEALYRRDGMKPIDNGSVLCPKCYRDIGGKPQYCPDCGQKIEWDDVT